MPDERPTSQHLVQEAKPGIVATPKTLAQLSSSGAAAQKKRKKPKDEDKVAAGPSNQGTSGAQDTKTEPMK